MNWMVSTIVVPSDGSAAAESQLASARAIARVTGARILVAHVDEILRGRMAAHSLHPCEDELKANVRRQVESLRDAGLRADVEFVASSDDLAGVITQLARTRNADLIVTRKERSRRLFGLLFGGVSRRLLRLAPCPVLVVK